MSGASDTKYLNSCLVFLLAKDLVAQIRMLAGGCPTLWLRLALASLFFSLMDLKLDSEIEGCSGPSWE